MLLLNKKLKYSKVTAEMLEETCKKSITKLNTKKLFYINYIISLLFFISSCSVYTMRLPNTLQPPNTYPAGKGEIGARTSVLLPEGTDFKVGLTDHVQLSGIASAEENSVQVYEGSILINTQDAHKKSGKYLNVFALGGGVNEGYNVKTGETTIGNFKDTHYISGPSYYIYAGWYPGFKLNEHIGINVPLKIYALSGDYKYYTTTSGTTNTSTTSTLLRVSTAAFIPEVDFTLDWTHIGVNLGLDLPLQFYESTTPVFVFISTNISGGIYYKW